MPAFPRDPGWRRWMAAGLMAVGGLGALSDAVGPDDPLALTEARLLSAFSATPIPPGDLKAELRRSPLYAQAARESAWRASARKAHRAREVLRCLAVGLGALALAWGILSRSPWEGLLLGAGILVWTGLYAVDLREGSRLLGKAPWIYAWGQGLNLACLAGLWAWLRRDRRGQPSSGAIGSGRP